MEVFLRARAKLMSVISTYQNRKESMIKEHELLDKVIKTNCVAINIIRMPGVTVEFKQNVHPVFPTVVAKRGK